MSVSTILLPVFVHVAFVFVLIFRDIRTAPPANGRAGLWRDELAIAVLFYTLTVCAWQTRLADILFLVLAFIFVALRIIGGLRYGPANGPAHRNGLLVASLILLAAMWAIYAVRLLLALS
jgi:hypothetical protein